MITSDDASPNPYAYEFSHLSSVPGLQYHHMEVVCHAWQKTAVNLEEFEVSDENNEVRKKMYFLC